MNEFLLRSGHLIQTKYLWANHNQEALQLPFVPNGFFHLETVHQYLKDMLYVGQWDTRIHLPARSVEPLYPTLLQMLMSLRQQQLHRGVFHHHHELRSVSSHFGSSACTTMKIQVLIAISISRPCESSSFLNTVSKLSKSTQWRKAKKKVELSVISGICDEKKMQIDSTVSICA